MFKRNYKTVEAYHFEARKDVPNHPELPALIYGGVLEHAPDIGATFARTFAENAWVYGGRRQLSGDCCYHIHAHEALGVARGSALLQLGGSDGKQVELRRGDLLLLPAGTGHRLIAASADFQVISACPEGQANDDLIGETKLPIESIAFVVESTPYPKTDPFFGRDGPLFDFWYR